MGERELTVKFHISPLPKKEEKKTSAVKDGLSSNENCFGGYRFIERIESKEWNETLLLCHLAILLATYIATLPTDEPVKRANARVYFGVTGKKRKLAEELRA